MEEVLKKDLLVKQNQRYLFVDVLESIAIFFVVFYHSTTYCYNFLQNSGFVFYLRYYLRSILSVCVPLFFVCNGFLLFQKNFNLKKHLLKILKFVALILIWGTISVLVVSFYQKTKLSVTVFFEYLFYFKNGINNHLWFLQALLAVYLIFPLLKIVFDNNLKIFVYFFIVSFILTFGNNLLNIALFLFSKLFFGYTFNLGFNFFNWFDIFGSYAFSIVYFCAGGILYILLSKIKQIKAKKLNIICFAILLFSTLFWFLISVLISKETNQVYDIVWNGYDTVFTFLNTVTIVLIFVCIEIKNKHLKNFVELISKNTLGIYFLHWLFVRTIGVYLKNISFFNGFFVNIVYAFLIILLCVFLSKLIKKIPVVKNII